MTFSRKEILALCLFLFMLGTIIYLWQKQAHTAKKTGQFDEKKAARTIIEHQTKVDTLKVIAERQTRTINHYYTKVVQQADSTCRTYLTELQRQNDTRDSQRVATIQHQDSIIATQGEIITATKQELQEARKSAKAERRKQFWKGVKIGAGAIATVVVGAVVLRKVQPIP